MADRSFAFSSTALRALTCAGWFPGRSADTRAYERALEEDGYEVFPVVLEFLSEFGGLSIVHERLSGKQDTPCFDAKIAAESVFPEQVAAYSSQVDASLCVVGEYCWRLYTIMMDQDGRSYGGVDQNLDYLGGTGVQAIENIISGENIIPLSR
jgi:hypothetical protein